MLLIAFLGLQAGNTTGGDDATVFQHNCMSKTLLQNQPVADLQLIDEDKRTGQMSGTAAMGNSCQSMSSFVAASPATNLSNLPMNGWAVQSVAVLDTLLFDDRTSDPPRHYC